MPRLRPPHDAALYTLAGLIIARGPAGGLAVYRRTLHADARRYVPTLIRHGLVAHGRRTADAPIELRLTWAGWLRFARLRRPSATPARSV